MTLPPLDPDFIIRIVLALLVGTLGSLVWQVGEQILDRRLNVFRGRVFIPDAERIAGRQLGVLFVSLFVAGHCTAESGPPRGAEHLLEPVDVFDVRALSAGLRGFELFSQDRPDLVDLSVPLLADVAPERLPVARPPADNANSGGEEGPEVTCSQFFLHVLAYGLPPAVIGIWLGGITGRRRAARERRERDNLFGRLKVDTDES